MQSAEGRRERKNTQHSPLAQDPSVTPHVIKTWFKSLSVFPGQFTLERRKDRNPTMRTQSCLCYLLAWSSPPPPPPPCGRSPLSLCAEWFQSCPTLCNALARSTSGSSVHGFLQERILKWVVMASSRGSSRCRDWTHVSYVSCIDRWVLYHSCHLGNSEVFQKPSITTAFLTSSSVFPRLLQRLTWRGYTPTPPKQRFQGQWGPGANRQDRKRSFSWWGQPLEQSGSSLPVSSRICRVLVPP